MSAKKKVHIVSYTHWDREFRFDFENTRMWLVRLMDNLLDIMEKNPAFKYYTLDGQFTLVADYLEARPEKEAQIRKLVKNGRLCVGPWYTLPDSSSVNGESLIRNLLTGLKRADEFGGAMRIGYNVFSFGQISQLPQLYDGFGIDTIIFYKHMDRRRSKYDEFIWEGPDGTQALASRLGTEARWNFFFAGHIPIVYDQDPWHKDWHYEWGHMGKSFHFCEPDNYAGFHFITDPDTDFHVNNIKEGFERTFETLKETAAPEHLLFFDGTDFTEAHPLIPDIIEEARKVFGSEYDIVHSTLQQYISAIKPIVKTKDLDIVTGHMKDGPVGSIHTDVLSVHPELKRANSRAENALYRYAEPLASIAWLMGNAYPQPLINKALKNLFESQAHDSLHGVGPETLSKGVESRLLQAKIIADTITTDALQVLASKINTENTETGNLFITVFNPTPSTRSDIVEAYIDIPREWSVDELILEDSQGNLLELYELQRIETKAGIYHPRSRNMPFYINRFRLLFHAQDIPAMGYKTFSVSHQEQALYPYPHEDFDAVKIPYSPLAQTPRSAENDFVKLSIIDDGTIEIINKQTGRHYKKLHYFMDEGQKGNQQRAYPPKINKIMTTLGKTAEISLIINNPLMAKFAIETQLSVPAYFDQLNDRRSSEEVIIPIRSDITLKKHSPVIEVETTVDNTAKDHFLRVCFETGIQTDFTYSSEVFNTESHPTCPTQDGIWQGPELRRHQQHLFMDIHDKKEGLAILNDTLRDYEIIDPNNGTIAQSIVRSVELRIPCDNRLWMEYPGDDSTQSLGKHTFRYGLYPHSGSWEKASVYHQALTFNVPLRIVQLAKQQGILDINKSFLEIESPNLILSALKKTQDRNTLIMRVYNPTNKSIRSSVAFGFHVNAVHRTRLDETRQGQVQSSDNTIQIEVGARKIATFEIECQ